VVPLLQCKEEILCADEERNSFPAVLAALWLAVKSAAEFHKKQSRAIVLN
jgi:hypothetical protein